MGCLSSGSLTYGQITVDVDCPIGPEIEFFGWDLKGSTSLGNPLSRAQAHYEDTAANLVRIPVFATSHAENGDVDLTRYNNVLASLQNILSINPDVKVFASLRLEGANTFPEWIESNNDGSIFGNSVKRPDPDRYSQLLTDYVEFMWMQGIKIEYFGIMNEVRAAILPNEFIDTTRLFRQKMIDRGIPEDFRTFEWIGAETFAVTPSVAYTRDVIELGGADTITLGGAHMYPIMAQENDNAWLNFAAELPQGTPLWHTEVHMPVLQNISSVSSNVRIIRNSYAILGGAARSGISGFVWWARGDSQTTVTRILKRRAIDIMLGSQPVRTTPEHPVQFSATENGDLFQAYRKGDIVEIVLIRDNENPLTDLHVDLQGRAMRRFVEIEGYRGTGTELGTGAFQFTPIPVRDADGGGFTIPQLAADSFSRIQIELAPEPEVVFSFDYESNGQFDSLGGRRFTAFGTTTSNFDAGADVEFGSSIMAVNSSTTGNNTGPGFMYLPTNVAWEPNTRYTINLSVLDRAGQADDAEIEYGLWSGLPIDDNGGGAYAGNLSGNNAVAAQTMPSLGTSGQLIIVSDGLDSENGLANGNWAGAADLGCTSEQAAYQQFSFATSNDVTSLDPMVLFLRTARNAQTNGTGRRAHFDNITITKEPLVQFIPVAFLSTPQGIQFGAAGANIATSDDDRLKFIPSKPVARGEASVIMVMEALAPTADSFIFEVKASSPNLTYIVEPFNWTTNQFEVLTAGQGSFSDQLLNLALDPALHVNQNGIVRTRIRWIQAGPVIAFPWNIEVDLMGWQGP